MSEPLAGDGAEFRQVLGHFSTGVAVVTSVSGRGPVGLSVNSFTAVSLRPPLVAFCAARRSRTWASIRPSGIFCVNLLAADQEVVARVFATPGADRFANLDWAPSPSGAPRIHGSLAWIDCTIDAVHPGGDHEICVGAVTGLEVGREDGPLVFYRGGYGRFEA